MLDVDGWEHLVLLKITHLLDWFFFGDCSMEVRSFYSYIRYIRSNTLIDGLVLTVVFCAYHTWYVV